METQYIEYLGVRIVCCGDGRAFADFPSDEQTVNKVKAVFPNENPGELHSDKSRYRVWGRKNALGDLVKAVEKAMLS